MCSKNGVFRYFWGYVQDARIFFGFFSQMPSFSTILFLQNELLNSHERFFFTKIRPYQVLTFIRTTLCTFTLTIWCIQFAFEKLFWKFVLAGFDGLWIRIYSQKIDISISKMADPKWWVEIYEIKRFCSIKTLYSKLL